MICVIAAENRQVFSRVYYDLIIVGMPILVTALHRLETKRESVPVLVKRWRAMTEWVGDG